MGPMERFRRAPNTGRIARLRRGKGWEAFMPGGAGRKGEKIGRFDMYHQADRALNALLGLKSNE
jgi:hypothetical protein